ncbi:hypothetical protein PENTCL1PPCAC_15024, partial [Pristionchus entomophagus]
HWQCILQLQLKSSTPACSLHSLMGDNSMHIPSWNIGAEPGINNILINVNENVSIIPLGREIIVQAHFRERYFRPPLDFALSNSVPDFNSETWKQRPSIMPLKRKVDFILVADLFSALNSSGIPQIQCDENCFTSLLNSSFCLLPPSSTFQSRLLSSLRAGCIPVLLSPSQPLPFQDQLDWRLASFHFPLSMLDFIPEMLVDLDKEDVLEMRRRGRIFLARIDDAQALSKTLVAAL